MKNTKIKFNIPDNIYYYNNSLLCFAIFVFFIVVYLSYNVTIHPDIECSHISSKILIYKDKFTPRALCNAEYIYSYHKTLIFACVISSVLFIFAINMLFIIMKFEERSRILFDANPFYWKKEKLISVAFMTTILLFSFFQYAFKNFYIIKIQPSTISLEEKIISESFSFIIFFLIFFVVNFIVIFIRTKN